MVAGLAATTTVGYGVLFYAYGVLLLPMQEDLGWRRSVLTAAFSAALLVAALLTVPVGRWLDRHQPRPLLLGGAVGAVMLVAGWAGVNRPLPFFLVWIGIGCCMATLFYEPAFTIITKRLSGSQRHRAVTSVTLVAGLASTIFGPLTAALENALGWRGAVGVLAAILGVVTIPVFAVVLRARPAGEPPVVNRADAGTREVIRTRQFWLLTFAYLLSAITTFAIAVHLVPYLRGHGWPAGRAAVALGAVGLVQVVGRSGFTRLAARLSAGRLGTWVLGAKAVGISALVLSPTIGGVAIFLAIYGAANGLQTLTRATVIADLYGTRSYGSISAVTSAVSAIGGSLAPFMVAAAIEIAGTDEPVLWGLAVLAAGSAVANAIAIRYTRKPRAPTAHVRPPVIA